MLAIYYVIVCFVVGFIINKKFLSIRFSEIEVQVLVKKKTNMPSFSLWFFSSFLIGTIVVTWSVYFVSYMFKQYKNPLTYGNVICLFVFTLLCTIYFLKSKIKVTNKNSIYNYIQKHKVEMYLILAGTLIWSLYMYLTFYMDGTIMNIGYSVYSDFGPHLGVIRSFSYGANFPTEYPHFADGTIRYHFMFQFLVGNLEYLGLNIANAFNVPSVLSMLATIMLLYVLTIIITGSKAAGILANVFFFFRSSFAWLTFSKDFKSFPAFIHAVIYSKNINGYDRAHIGETLHEDWGLWSQNVYVNQRHLSFAMGVMLLIVILVMPYFYKSDLKSRKIRDWFSELFLKTDSWMPNDITVAVVCGLLLGGLAFWNGAVVIATLSTLCILAIFSKNKLSFLIIACITTTLTLLQSKLFIPYGNQVVSPELCIGFLAGPDIVSIIKYVVALLGVLPFILLCIFIPNQTKRCAQRMIKGAIVLGAFTVLNFYMPETKVFWKVATPTIIIGFIGLYQNENRYISKEFIALLLSFTAPFVIAFSLNLTPDIAVNHKYIMISTMLLNMLLAAILLEMIKSSKKSKFAFLKKIFVTIVIVMLTSTGIIDALTVVNLNENAVRYDNEDKMLLWVKENTNPNDMFLTYQSVVNPVLLAGRKIYYGWPYYAFSAGYNVQEREVVIDGIYGGNNAEVVRALAKKNQISYVVIDADNRNAEEYDLNEKLFDDYFKLVYVDELNNKIYSVE